MVIGGSALSAASVFRSWRRERMGGGWDRLFGFYCWVDLHQLDFFAFCSVTSER